MGPKNISKIGTQQKYFSFSFIFFTLFFNQSSATRKIIKISKKSYNDICILKYGELGYHQKKKYFFLIYIGFTKHLKNPVMVLN